MQMYINIQRTTAYHMVANHRVDFVCVKSIHRLLFSRVFRVLTNSKFGLFYSNFLILTPTFSKVPIEKYGKTPNFSGKQHFYSYFQNPSENSAEYFFKASMPALNNWPDCWHTLMLFSLFEFCAVRLAQKDCSQLPLQ